MLIKSKERARAQLRTPKIQKVKILPTVFLNRLHKNQDSAMANFIQQ